MKTLIRIALALLALTSSLGAFALTPAQLTILKTAILAETDPTFVSYRVAGATGAMADWYSQPSAPAFIVWKTAITAQQVGQA